MWGADWLTRDDLVRSSITAEASDDVSSAVAFAKLSCSPLGQRDDPHATQSSVCGLNLAATVPRPSSVRRSSCRASRSQTFVGRSSLSPTVHGRSSQLGVVSLSTRMFHGPPWLAVWSYGPRRAAVLWIRRRSAFPCKWPSHIRQESWPLLMGSGSHQGACSTYPGNLIQ